MLKSRYLDADTRGAWQGLSLSPYGPSLGGGTHAIGPALVEPCDVVFRFTAGAGAGGQDRYDVVTSAIKSNVSLDTLRLTANVAEQDYRIISRATRRLNKVLIRSILRCSCRALL
eukprot:4502859-Pyramimonas_sp.AAC.1